MTGLLDQEDLQLVENRLRKFRVSFDLWSVPVDCFRLVRTIQDSGKIRIRREDVLLAPDYFWGMTGYDAETDQYMILLKTAPLNWKRYSSWRRYNFTLAHELGHIAFGHPKIPMHLKTKEVQLFEEAEADAFASRLLMPEEALKQFCSVEEAADALWVSKSAILHRIRESGVLLAIRTCPNCGFDRIPPAARYCRMCGQCLEEIPGPPAEPEIRYIPPLPEECPVCGYKEPAGPDGVCLNCYHPKRNHCLPEYNQDGHICPQDALFCEICGAETLYKDLLR